MATMEEINWSAVARKEFEEKVEQVEFLKKLARKSRLTEKDAAELAEKINLGVARKFRGMT
jgi:hypothetical protein